MRPRSVGHLMLVAALGLGLLVGVIIGALGGGGGMLTVPVLVYLLGLGVQDAMTSSLVIVAIIAAVGTLDRARGRLVDWRTGLVFGAVGVPVAWLGSVLNRVVAGPVLLLAFSGLAVLAAAALLVNARGPAPGPDDARPASRGSIAAPPRARPSAAVLATAAKIVVCGLAVGFLTGFLGVGGGFLVVPALAVVLRMPMNLAIGTSLLVITVNAAASLVSRIGVAEFDPAVVIPFTAAAVLGALAGRRVSDRLSGAALGRAFAGLLLVVGLLVAMQSGVALLAG